MPKLKAAKPKSPEAQPLAAPGLRPHGLNVRDWTQDSERRKVLASLLAHPVMREALETLNMSFFPQANPIVSVPGSQIDPAAAGALERVYALRYAHSAGFMAYYNGLHNLAREKVPAPETPKPFGELLPETPTQPN